MKECKCEFCGVKLESKQQKANHIRWNHKNKDFYDSFISNHKKAWGIRKSNSKGQLKQFKVECFKCQKTFEISEYEKQFPKKEKYYCSKQCANSRIFTQESKDKKSIKSKLAWKEGRLQNFMLNKDPLRSKFNSKSEIEVREYFKAQFPNDEWTSGGGIKIKGKQISRDLYSNKLKVCIEYDGIWHFKDIKGQLKQKQEKDKLLEEWCLLNKFRLIRVKDEVYLKNKTETLNKLTKEVYEGIQTIVKFY